VAHGRHHGVCRQSAYPPRLSVNSDIVAQQPCANTGREQMQQDRLLSPPYTITSSASASSVGGMARPSTRAAWPLITSSNLLD
jgi:hypothetical protein